MLPLLTITLTLLLLTFSPSTHSTLTVTCHPSNITLTSVKWSNSDINATHLNTPISLLSFKYAPPLFLPSLTSSNATATATATSDNNATLLGYSPIAGKYILYYGPYGTLGYMEPLLAALFKVYDQLGVVAVFIIDEKRVPGYSALYLLPSSQRLSLAYGFVGRSADLIVQAESKGVGGVNVTFHGWDPNEWEIFYSSPGFVVYMLSLTLIHAGIVCMALYKLGRWLLHEGRLSLSITTCCLILEAVGTLLRGLYTVVYVRELAVLQRALETLYQPFNFTASLLLVFFWLDLTSDSLYQGAFLDRMRVPAYVCVCFMFTSEALVLMALFALGVDATGWALALYLVIATAVAVVYFVAGYRVLRMGKELTSKHLLSVTARIVSCGACYVVAVILAGLMLVQQCVDDVPGQWIIYYLLYIVLCTVNFLQVSVFDVPKEKKIHSTSSTPQRNSGALNDK